ncbi:MAG: PilZ domain-containing protein [Nitrospirae bacterium]|nr:PilZ domain-containing protein [Nitrospirota bacterium]
MTVERREYLRISLVGKIYIKPRGATDTLTGYAVNISKGGLALYSEKAFDINTGLLLTISFKYNTEEKREDVNGIVRWVKPVNDLFAIGVQFKGLRRDTHPVIFSYLELTNQIPPP